MSLPACDYDAILASEPTTWRDRGLHFHAYSWRGDGQSMQANEQARQDLTSDLPPVLVRDWLRKPQRLLRTAATTPEDAVAWLRREYEAIQPQIMGDIGEAISVERLMRMEIYDLRCGNDPVIVRWLRGGTMVHLAVLSVSGRECDRH